MVLIWGFEQYRPPAAQWHDGQFTHDAYARIARRANHPGQIPIRRFRHGLRRCAIDNKHMAECQFLRAPVSPVLRRVGEKLFRAALRRGRDGPCNIMR
jgi:hypothetical protein